jgi:N-methylhydantoinase A
MNAYVNPAHEEAAGRLLQEFGFQGEISFSHRLSREYRDYERASTTAINAFVRTRVANYLDRLASGIRELGFAGTCHLHCARSRIRHQNLEPSGG